MTSDAMPATAIPASATRRMPLLTPRRSNIILVIAAAVLLPTLTYRAMPLLFSRTLALNLEFATAVAIGALSLNLLTGYAGQISLGHGALLTVGAFVAGWTTSGAGLPMWLALPFAGVVTGLIALLVGFPALRLRGLYLAIITIAFAYVMYNGVLRINLLSAGSSGIELVRRLWGATAIPEQADMLAAALVVLVLAWLLDANVTRTKLGRALRAVRENESVAASFGVDVPRYKLTAFVVSGMLAGVAGALFCFGIGSVQSDTFYLPFDYSLSLIIIVVIGGLGSRVGVVAAAYAFAVFNYAFHSAVPSGSPLYGLIPSVGALLLMFTVARNPGGFAGAIAESRERKGRRAAMAAADEEPPMPAIPVMPHLRDATPGGSAAVDAPVLEARDITVRFGGLTAVDGASLVVPRGQIVGLIGPNGAGKTTFFNCVSGLVRPTAGRVLLGAHDVSALGAHRRAQLGMARTFQQVGLAKDQTILENMLLAQHLLASYGDVAAVAYTPRAARSEEEMRTRATATIDALGFGGRENVPVRLLSGGQQRIVEVACALLTDPELLMLDEPSAGMAPAAVESLTDRLRELRDQQGRTVLLIEHNVPMVFDLCDYVYVLNFGRVLAKGTPEEILEHPDVIAAYLGAAA